MITREEAYEILKKYDQDCYKYYMHNAAYFGPGAYHYAESLKQSHEPTSCIYEENRLHKFRDKHPEELEDYICEEKMQND